MPKPLNPEKPIEDLSQALAGLGEKTTAAELVRTKGQSKKLTVITEKQLMEWVKKIISQHFAGKADSYSDKEKEDLLKKLQDDLNTRMKREQDHQAENARMKADLDLAIAKASEAQSANATREQTAEAIDSLKKQLEERAIIIENLQVDRADLEDQLAENRALASTTVAEKEELKQEHQDQLDDLAVAHKQALMNYMRHANPLVEGVVGLDNQLYGGRHAEENPVSEDAEAEEQFYHEYDVGAKIIETLSNDLQRLRGIAQNAKQQTDKLASDPRMNLLEGDLKLLEQLKEGSLSAVDVAEPVEGLVEAMNGARSEAQQLDHTGKGALGSAAGREDAISAVPESGEPAEVIAGAMAVARELATVMGRGRQRMVALKEMADQADEARNTAEEELGEIRAAYQQVLAALGERAKADKMRVPTALVDEDAPAAESSAKAQEIIKNIKGGGDAKPVLAEQILLMDNLLGEEAGVHMAPPAKDAKEEDLVARLREDGAALARLVKDKSAALAAALAREKALAEDVRVLARTQLTAAAAANPANIIPEHQGEAPLDVSVAKLGQALDQEQEPAQVGAAIQQVIAQLRDQLAKAPSGADIKRLDDERGRLASQIGQAQQKIRGLEEALAQAKGEAAAIQARTQDQRRAEREMASELVRAAKGDDQLADSFADLALVADDQDEENLVPALREAVTGLTRRKQDLSDENQRLRADLEQVRAKAQEAETRGASLNDEQQKLGRQLAGIQQHAQELERDLSRARTDLDLMRNQAQEANSRRSMLEAERGKITAQLLAMETRLRDTDAELAKARGELAALTGAVKEQRDVDRSVATELVSAAQTDPDLADALGDLASALEDTPSSESPADPLKVSRQVAAGVARLAQRKRALEEQAARLHQDGNALKWQLKEANERATELEGERDEMAASGKEVISQLTQKRERTDLELANLKQEHEKAENLLATLQHRTSAAESANRNLAEALSTLASMEKDQQSSDVEAARVDLEVSLSQLPDEGEDAVSIPQDISLQLADSGRKLAEALLQRRQQMTSNFKRVQADHAALNDQLEQMRGEVLAAQTRLDEQQTALRSSQAEVKAVRHELTMQGKDLAAKVQELTSTRGDVASIKAELDVAAQRVEEQDRRLQQTSAKLAETQREQERLLRELSTHQQRADAAEHAQGQLVQSLRGLTNRQDAAPAVARALTDADQTDPLSKAAQKLDLARAAGPEQLASAGQAYVQALKDRVQAVAERLEESRGALTAAKRNEDAMQSDLAALRASVVDREHQLRNRDEEAEKAKAEQSELLSQIMEQRRRHDAAAAELKKVAEELRLAQAEIADYQARQGASSGHFSSDNDRLRQEAEHERQQRAQMEATLSALRERAESGEARLKSQREELTRRLAERDSVIQQKDRELDELASQRGDAKSLEAQIAATTKELAAAHDRIKELEGVHGAHAGSTVKSGDLARELKHLQGERDQLREKHRLLEADLADAVSMAAQLTSQLDEKRKDHDLAHEKSNQQLLEARNAAQAARDEIRRFKEENVGLKARIRRLTETGPGGGPSGGFKTV
jgi:chromosome segregation ATPase